MSVLPLCWITCEHNMQNMNYYDAADNDDDNDDDDDNDNDDNISV